MDDENVVARTLIYACTSGVAIFKENVQRVWDASQQANADERALSAQAHHLPQMTESEKVLQMLHHKPLDTQFYMM